MATVHYNTCDHCGKRLNNMTDFIDMELETMVLRRVDLCSNCWKEFDSMVSKFLREDIKKDGAE